MAITYNLLDRKIDDLQVQMSMLRREFDLFRGYVNRQFEHLFRTVATKDDVSRLVSQEITGLATKQEVGVLQAKVDGLKTLLLLVAKQVGVESLDNPS